MRFEFLEYVLDTNAHALTHNGVDRKIEPQVFDLLLLLLENAGELVTRDLLVERIWNGRIVSESAISARIAAARKAVGDDGKKQAVIRTVARRGLQFVASVSAPAKPKQQNVRKSSDTLKIRYATTSDGAKLAYSVHGTGMPFIRVQHFPTHLELDWNEPIERAYIDAYAEHSMLVRFDHRGCGLSEPDITGLSTERIVEDISAVVDALELEKFALIGVSGGSQTAVCFAATYPERVSKLIIQSGYVDGRSIRNRNLGKSEPDVINRLMREGWDQAGTAFLAAAVSVYQPGGSPELYQKMAGNLQASSTSEAAVEYRTLANSRSVEQYLGKIQAPTLVIHSKDDAVHPLSEARKMASGIKGAELIVLESPNHYVMPHEAAWDVHLAALFEFLDRPD
jgi:pimeloyl-ACP methyl ester carboxylesterase